MLPSRSTAANTDAGSYPLDARAMREIVAVFDDPAFDDWADLFPLQDQAVAAVEAVLGAPIRAKSIVDHYGCAPADRRLDLSARPVGGLPLRSAQFGALVVTATVPGPAEVVVDAALDLTGDAPAAVLAEDAPSLADLANPLRAAYQFDPQAPLATMSGWPPMPPLVVGAVAFAFRGAFDARYRGAPPLPTEQIEELLAGESVLLGPYD